MKPLRKTYKEFGIDFTGTVVITDAIALNTPDEPWPNASKTPQTDAAEEKSFGLHNNSLSARAAGWAFARQLEQELNALKALKPKNKYELKAL